MEIIVSYAKLRNSKELFEFDKVAHKKHSGAQTDKEFADVIRKSKCGALTAKNGANEIIRYLQSFLQRIFNKGLIDNV